MAAIKHVIGSLDHLKTSDQIALSQAALRWGVKSTDGINSPEWERRQRWYGYHQYC